MTHLLKVNNSLIQGTDRIFILPLILSKFFIILYYECVLLAVFVFIDVDILHQALDIVE